MPQPWRPGDAQLSSSHSHSAWDGALLWPTAEVLDAVWSHALSCVSAPTTLARLRILLALLRAKQAPDAALLAQALAAVGAFPALARDLRAAIPAQVLHMVQGEEGPDGMPGRLAQPPLAVAGLPEAELVAATPRSEPDSQPLLPARLTGPSKVGAGTLTSSMPALPGHNSTLPLHSSPSSVLEGAPTRRRREPTPFPLLHTHTGSRAGLPALTQSLHASMGPDRRRQRRGMRGAPPTHLGTLAAHVADGGGRVEAESRALAGSLSRHALQCLSRGKQAHGMSRRRRTGDAAAAPTPAPLLAATLYTNTHLRLATGLSRREVHGHATTLRQRRPHKQRFGASTAALGSSASAPGLRWEEEVSAVAAAAHRRLTAVQGPRPLPMVMLQQQHTRSSPVLHSPVLKSALASPKQRSLSPTASVSWFDEGGDTSGRRHVSPPLSPIRRRSSSGQLSPLSGRSFKAAAADLGAQQRRHFAARVVQRNWRLMRQWRQEGRMQREESALPFMRAPQRTATKGQVRKGLAGMKAVKTSQDSLLKKLSFKSGASATSADSRKPPKARDAAEAEAAGPHGADAAPDTDSAKPLPPVQEKGGGGGHAGRGASGAPAPPPRPQAPPSRTSLSAAHTQKHALEGEGGSDVAARSRALAARLRVETEHADAEDSQPDTARPSTAPARRRSVLQEMLLHEEADEGLEGRGGDVAVRPASAKAARASGRRDSFSSAVGLALPGTHHGESSDSSLDLDALPSLPPSVAQRLAKARGAGSDSDSLAPLGTVREGTPTGGGSVALSTPGSRGGSRRKRFSLAEYKAGGSVLSRPKRGAGASNSAGGTGSAGTPDTPSQGGSGASQAPE